jgi:hypothetical protein
MLAVYALELPIANSRITPFFGHVLGHISGLEFPSSIFDFEIIKSRFVDGFLQKYLYFKNR